MFYLKLSNETEDVSNMVQVGSKKNLWHRRFGHLSEKGLKELIKKELVSDSMTLIVT